MTRQHPDRVLALWRLRHKTAIVGRWQPDFAFKSERVLVQADGTYWHGLPSAKVRDAAFNQAAAQDGWTVLRFDEQEIKRNLARCVEVVRGALQARKAP